MNRLFTKANFAKLSRRERTRLMHLQMASGGGPSAYLPDDCFECDSCGTPALGSGGMCSPCLDELIALLDKLAS